MLRNQRGLTVIELLLAVALTAIVLSLVAAFFKTTNYVFVEGKEQASVQHDIRMASEVISRTVRNATKITLTNGAPDANQVWVYRDVDGRLKERSGMDIKTLTRGGLIQSVTYTISGTAGKYILAVDVISTDGYSLNTEIFMNNLDEASDVTNNGSTNIQFTSP